MVFTIGVIFQTTAEQLQKIPGIIKSIIDATDNATFDRSHFSAIGDFSRKFETVYYIESPDYSMYMDAQQKIYLDIIYAFEKENITIGYPTQTLYADNSFGNETEESQMG